MLHRLFDNQMRTFTDGFPFDNNTGPLLQKISRMVDR